MIIYIPIWLDLLYYEEREIALDDYNLHSNMVRFIIRISISLIIDRGRFTFQYG